jgi:hypothetical protein
MTVAPVMSITEELIAELERLAGKATGGDWEYRLGLISTMPGHDGSVPIAVAPNSPKNWRGQRDTNMQYIAAANPAVIRALLAERAELKADIDQYAKAFDALAGRLGKACIATGEVQATNNLQELFAWLEPALAERAELKRRAAQGDWLIEYMASERDDLDDTLMEGCSDNRPHVLRSIIDAMQAAQ